MGKDIGMKRQRQNNKHSKSPNQTKPIVALKKALTRRTFIQNVRDGIITAAFFGGGAWLVFDDVMATLDEQDLSKLGNGIPTIVQIHDPQCPMCTALQRETRKALDNFDTGQLQYLVANIKSVEGRALATTHGVEHVTLLLFDAMGTRRQILTGPNQSSYLTEVFQQHLEKYRRN